MRFRFVLDGPKYSRHKAAFKQMLSEHRLAWRGNMTEFVWIGPKERVRAEFELAFYVEMPRGPEE